MQVREVMTKDVKTASPEDTIQNAADLMGQINCGSLPVAENDRLIGMVTDRDITLRAVARGKASATVREIMSPRVLYIFDDETTEAAANNMSKAQVRRLPVVNREKRLVGILALGDLAVKRDGKEAGSALKEISQP